MSTNNLDSAINQTESNGNRIVTENNDYNTMQISAVDAGSWDACEMGMSLEAAQQMILEAAGDATKMAAVVKRIQQSARNRANYATIAGKIAVISFGPTWNRLGVEVDDRDGKPLTTAEVVKLCPAVQYHAEKIQCGIQSGDKFLPIDDQYGVKLTYFDGSEFVLPNTTVGKNQTFWQTADGFDFIDEALSDFGQHHWKCVGALGNGERTFMTAKLGNDIKVAGNTVGQWLVTLNGFNGKQQIQFAFTDTVAECENTAREAIRVAKRCLNFKHTDNVRTNVRRAKQAIVAAKKYWQEREQAYQAFAALPMPQSWLDDVLDACVDETNLVSVTKQQVNTGADALAAALDIDDKHREAKVKSYQRAIRKRENLLETILDLQQRQAETNGENTLWNGYNAVTAYANHGLRYNSSNDESKSLGQVQREQEERRFDSILGGQGDTINQIAYNMAVNVAR